MLHFRDAHRIVQCPFILDATLDMIGRVTLYCFLRDLGHRGIQGDAAY